MALHIPEILSSVLHQVMQTDSNLRADSKSLTISRCRLVNSAWEAEANRQIWRVCGERNRPNLRHLLKLPAVKRQALAKHIRKLYFDDSTSLNPHKWLQEARESAWSDELALPYLQELQIGRGPIWTASIATIPTLSDATLLRFLQPRLRKLSLVARLQDHSAVDGDLFFGELVRNCPGLTSLELDVCIGETNSMDFVTPQALTSLLATLRQLVTLKWISSSRHGDPFSSEAFAQLASLPYLKHLHMRPIKHAYVNGPHCHTISSDAILSALESIECETTSDILAMLVPHTTKLKKLWAELDPGSSGVLRILADARLSNMVDLRVYGDINGTASDMVRLASTVPSLECLTIANGDTNSPPGPDDAAVELLTGLLPRLCRLNLYFVGETLATEKSLLLLGARCPRIERISMSAQIDYTKLVQDTISWPNLISLNIGPRRYGLHASNNPIMNTPFEWNDNDLDLDILALMPSLRWMDIKEKSGFGLSLVNTHYLLEATKKIKGKGALQFIRAARMEHRDRAVRVAASSPGSGSGSGI